jgi:hypothetical protein
MYILMKACPLYNGQNLVFTGSANPYGLILKGGLRKGRTNKRTNKRRTNKMNKKRRNTHTKKRYNR